MSGAIKELRANAKRNICFFLMVSAGYLAFFPAASFYCYVMEAQCGARLFGAGNTVVKWLLFNATEGVFFPMAVSALPALFGKYRYSLTALFGFFIGIPLGEVFGEVPSKISSYHCGGHYEVFVWFAVFLLSVLMGMLLERLSPRGISWKSSKLRLWCAAFLLGIIAILWRVHTS